MKEWKMEEKQTEGWMDGKKRKENNELKKWKQ